MKLLTLITFAYLLLPLALLALRGLGLSFLGLMAPGCITSVLRFPLLAVIGFNVFSGGQLSIDLSGDFLSFSREFGFELDRRAFLFLCVIELCFFVSNWMIDGPNNLAIGIKQMMFLPLQFLLPAFILTSNLILAGCISILIGAILFFLLRLSESAGDLGFAVWADKFYRAYAFLGFSLAVWGIYIFSASKVNGGGSWGQAIWTVLLIACCPFPFWTRWYFPAIEKLGYSFSLMIICIHSVLIYKVAGLFSLFPSADQRLLDLLFAVGLFGGLYCLWTMATQLSLLAKFVRMIGFLFSLSLLSISLGGQEYFNSVFQISVYLPLLTIISMYLGGKAIWGLLDKTLVVLLSLFYLGFPGTPLFLIFSEIGGRSLNAGRGALLLFSLLWLAYFVSTSKLIGSIRGLLVGDFVEAVGEQNTWPALFPRLVLALIGLLLILTYLAWRV